MDGTFQEGWYMHPKEELIRISQNEEGNWVYRCYSVNGKRALSKDRPLDSWTWALSERAPDDFD